MYLAMTAFALSNALWCIQVVISVSTLIELLPDSKRAQGMGVSSAMNLTAQGLGTAFAGGLSELRSPAFALVFAGTSSIIFALWPGLLWIRADKERLPDHLLEPVPLDR